MNSGCHVVTVSAKSSAVSRPSGYKYSPSEESVSSRPPLGPQLILWCSPFCHLHTFLRYVSLTPPFLLLLLSLRFPWYSQIIYFTSFPVDLAWSWASILALFSPPSESLHTLVAMLNLVTLLELRFHASRSKPFFDWYEVPLLYHIIQFFSKPGMSCHI